MYRITLLSNIREKSTQKQAEDIKFEISSSNTGIKKQEYCLNFQILFPTNFPAMLILDIVPKLVLDNIPLDTIAFSRLLHFTFFFTT